MKPPLALSFVSLSLGLAIFAGHTPRPAPYQSPQSLAFVSNRTGSHWRITQRGAEKAAEELGIKICYPTITYTKEQNKILNDLLSKGTQGIAVCPIYPANQTDILDKVALGSLLFTYDQDAPDSKRACFIGVDDVAAGHQAGQELKRVLPYGGDAVIFVDRIDERRAAERISGLRQELHNSKIRLVDIRADYTDQVRAKQDVEFALATYPQLAACVGISAHNGPIILNVLKRVGKTGKIKIVCFDEMENTLEGVQKGQISAAIIEQPFKMGYVSVINMAKYLNGDKSVVPASRKVLIPTRVIRRDDVAAFKKQLAQWHGY